MSSLYVGPENPYMAYLKSEPPVFLRWDILKKKCFIYIYDTKIIEHFRIYVLLVPPDS